MNVQQITRAIGALLVLAIGGLLFAGGWQLWAGGPAVWPDVIATESSVARAAGGMIVMSIVLSLSAVMVVIRLPRYRAISALVLGIFVGGSVWANWVLFGESNLLHIATNIVVAGLAAVLINTDKLLSKG